MTGFCVMTFNIGNGLTEPAALVAALRGSTADVVAIQEIAAPQARLIQRDLADAYPHQIVQGHGIPGKALLSRWPLEQSGPLRFADGRPDLQATVLLPGGPVRIITAHPEPARFGRAGGVRNAATLLHIRELAAAAASGEATILAGDFNRLGWQTALRCLAAAGLRDAWQEAGRGFGATLPARWARGAETGHPLGRMTLPPLARVDFIWHTGHFRTDAAWLGDAAGSDHRPVLATLSWNPAP